VGDRVLMDMVSVMARVFRRGDYLVRTGGDEFLAILPACPVAAIDELKAKLEEELSRSRISVHDVIGSSNGAESAGFDPVIGYSASIGGAHYPDPGPPDPECFAALMAEADCKLYEMKRNSRRS
ncbi:MAG: diguanylate cyclase, partial [Spirochaetota bacterium]